FAAAALRTHMNRLLGVIVYHATDCSLCARALEVIAALHDELEFDLELVDIGGEPELEARYRELLPVVEIDGERAFTYFVEANALRERVRLAVLSTKSGEPQAES
ncbi:MAG: glutaredoxin family protein, partial [Gaiellaceae bacterium]